MVRARIGGLTVSEEVKREIFLIADNAMCVGERYHANVVRQGSPAQGCVREATHPNGLWMVYFEDAARPPEVFFGEGAEENARLRYKQARDHWSCHLLSRVPTKDADGDRAIGTPSATPAFSDPWDKCEFGIVAWEIDQGQIGISVKHSKGGSAWAVEPSEHVAKLLRDGLRYRWLRGYETDYSPMYQQGLCSTAMDEWIDAQMKAASDSKGAERG